MEITLFYTLYFRLDKRDEIFSCLWCLKFYWCKIIQAKKKLLRELERHNDFLQFRRPTRWKNPH